jgi:putative Holliday junction resolvase
MKQVLDDRRRGSGRWLGLDLGEKTIGVAISDELGLTAQPLKTLSRSGLEKDLEEIVTLASSRGATGIVIGLPRNMDGSLGVRAREALRFAELLKDRSGLAVRTWDERLSTVAVQRVLLEADVSRKKRRRVVDMLAAAYILQGFLDAPRQTKADGPPVVP